MRPVTATTAGAEMPVPQTVFKVQKKKNGRRPVMDDARESGCTGVQGWAAKRE